MLWNSFYNVQVGPLATRLWLRYVLICTKKTMLGSRAQHGLFGDPNSKAE